MHNKNHIITIVIAIGVGSLGFFAGMKFQSSKNLSPQNFANLSQDQRQQMFQQFRSSGGGNGGNGSNIGQRTNRNMGGFVSGEILKLDATSLSLKMQDGSSKLVFFSSSTPVSKPTTISASDLIMGQQIMVTGTPNQDGSITASTIQIRPSMPAGQPGEKSSAPPQGQ